MNDRVGIVVFEVRRDADGLYTATSPDLSDVFVAHRDFDRIVRDMPNIVRLWYQQNKGIEVEVGAARQVDDSLAIPLMHMPAEIAAQALQR